MLYLLHTIKDDTGRERLRPLPGQRWPNGQAIFKELNVQSNMEMRRDYKIGTIFCTDKLEERSSSKSKPYYQAGKIFPVGLKSTEYLKDEHMPTKEMEDALTEYMQKSMGQNVQNNGAATGQAGTDLLSIISANAKFSAPTIEDDGFFIGQTEWELLIRNSIRKKPTMLTGPAGTGKTELVMLACKKIGLDCHVYDMGSMMDPISGLLGVHRLENGGSVFDYAKFTEDVQKPGVILLDELSRAPATTLNILFPCLDSRRMLPVEIAGGKDMRSIPVHPECVFFATANLGAEYTGTADLDKALADRFMFLEMSYMPEDKEQLVLKQRTGADIKSAKCIAQAAKTLRKMYQEGEISTDISTRDTLRTAELVADGWPLATALELVFLPKYEGTKAEGERSIVTRVLMAL